ncbi:hypothetical protein OSB04_028163 [Centaurea solstitialis]|uniref:Retrovirus-related Pol polyprotein from transposon TNT 1-94-like beta-barrel domain-containing protein n=1 Tax=Centaurea solstitialis TaxID=347529 RepID=A0AA38VXE9_9ASTR|nr:hypothetical protein OSB04_028163 [Centaurea solstitialis]
MFEVSMPNSSTYETCNEFSNASTSEHESLSDFEESSTQVIETDIIAHKSVGQEMVNVPITTIALTNKRTGIRICPDFMDLCINVMTSFDLDRREKEKKQQNLTNCLSSLNQKPKMLEHMTGTLELLSSYLQQEGSSVAFRGNQKGKIKGYGMIVKGEVRMNQVSYVDGLKHNLITVSQLCDNGLDVMFKIKFCIMYKTNTMIEVMRANRRGNLYLIFFDTLKAKDEICLVSNSEE